MFLLVFILTSSFLVLTVECDEFVESGLTIKNTSSYLVQKREGTLKPVFLDLGVTYHANKIHGAISFSVNTTDLKEELKRHQILFSQNVDPNYKLKLCNFSNLCHLYHNTEIIHNKFVALKGEIVEILDALIKLYSPNDRDTRDPISFALAVASLAGVTVNRLSISRMEKQLREQAEKMSKFTKLFVTTNSLFKQITSSVGMIRDKIRSLSQAQQYSQLAAIVIENLDRVISHYTKVFEDLEGLYSGRFPAHLIKFSDIIHEFYEYESELNTHGLNPINVLPEILAQPYNLIVVQENMLRCCVLYRTSKS